jgi:hypothetical protein
VTGEPCRPDELRTLVAAILAAAWRVTSAVTSAPREQAGAARLLAVVVLVAQAAQHLAGHPT